MNYTKEAVTSALFAMLGSNPLVDRWWTIPNRAFGLRTPNEVWEQNPNTIRNYVFGYVFK